MKAITTTCVPRVYTNRGQHAEQIASATLAGYTCKASNKPYWMGGDVGDVQVKSARATICEGTDLQAHIERDAATTYAYVTADGSTLYLMSPTEWERFATTFATITRDSQKNGGRVKMRLKSEGKAMREWLKRATA